MGVSVLVRCGLLISLLIWEQYSVPYTASAKHAGTMFPTPVTRWYVHTGSRVTSQLSGPASHSKIGYSQHLRCEGEDCQDRHHAPYFHLAKVENKVYSFKSQVPRP